MYMRNCTWGFTAGAVVHLLNAARKAALKPSNEAMPGGGARTSSPRALWQRWRTPDQDQLSGSVSWVLKSRAWGSWFAAGGFLVQARGFKLGFL